jgi:Cellulose biosynthesis protein BcsS
MRCGRCVRAAAAVVAALLFCWVCFLPRRAQAGDDDDEAHAILFSGRDLWRNGVFLYGGMLAAPGGFEQDGPLLKLLFSSGAYRYNASDLGGEQVVGLEVLGAAMPGWRIKRGPVEMKFFFGPELQYHRLWPDDPGNRLRGHQFGLRFAAELWAEPSASTMLAADAAVSSIGSNYSGRLAFGWRLFDLFYSGPESQVYGGDGYAQLRFGLHLTSFRTDDITEWSAAAGWAIDSDRRSSPYVRLGLMRKVN